MLMLKTFLAQQEPNPMVATKAMHIMDTAKEKFAIGLS
jgi:hypothetical protein